MSYPRFTPWLRSWGVGEKLTGCRGNACSPNNEAGFVAFAPRLGIEFPYNIITDAYRKLVGFGRRFVYWAELGYDANQQT